ncbi:heme lyase CcmF/NrfE family subunit [Actinobacillus delphinicola]|uniref:Cytochrome c-type biogenesis protein CcmF n=1 Tax=Actinobacillus delphinicola TaxID=51161 RepID=A0A448TUM6_9PAST|nr:heme lyase CcmF/NrfE family subunit [Actinobacillus delphinicola]VEJ09707.1 cytochrome c-type biogenesis protein CcmF [Actinobacillus delphinicola]
MILAEFGYITLIASSLSALLLAMLPYIKFNFVMNNCKSIMTATVFSLFFFVATTFGILIALLVQDDFSVRYVANHSNHLLPTLYKVAASWAGHSGSMLFLVVLFSIWSLLFCCTQRHRFNQDNQRVLAFLGIINAIFLLFLIFFSNPFTRIFPAPLEGGDLNPMLQDIGLIFHPPLLYLGYSAFAVVFSITLTYLIKGNFPSSFALDIKPWVLIGWVFLTLGIMLGAWWAYYELGWGGWWFWDPSENASLMPWLIATALLHSLSANIKSNAFPYWTILLALCVFILSLLGIFIVRSGILTSVHAFAQDNSRGLGLLIIFCFFSLLAFGFFATRLKTLMTPPRYGFWLYLLLGVNILFSLATFIVFLGSFYPLFYHIFDLGSISVGAPYFNKLFLPLVILALIGMSTILLPPIKKWRNGLPYLILEILSVGIAYWIVISYLPKADTFPWQAFLFLILAITLIIFTLWKIVIGPRNLAMLLSHSGIALVVFATTMASYFTQTQNIALAPHQKTAFAGYHLAYKDFQNLLGSNFVTEQAQFLLSKEALPIATIYTEKRYYDVRDVQMSEIGINSTPKGDMYIVMGDKRGNGAFAFRIQYKPFMIWLWIGGFCIALGGVIGLLQRVRGKRYD